MGVGRLIKNPITSNQKAVANGVAPLNASAKIPKTHIDLVASDVGALSSESDPTVPIFAKGLTSASDVLTAIKTVDGTGSGLDADLVRGVNPSTFLTTETDPTVTSYTKTLTSNDAILTALNAASGTISASRLPSYVDDVLSYAALINFPGTGETGKIYVAEDTNKVYRWTGSAYVEISSAATADTALKLSNPRTISASGDATYSVSFDGSANVTAALTLANVQLFPGSYGSSTLIPGITIDGKGRVTGATAFTVTPTWSNVSAKPTVLTDIAALTQTNKNFLISNGTTWTSRALDVSTDATGILGVANGGTGNSGQPGGRVMLSSLITSSQLQWDNTNKWLGVGSGTPAYPLDVF
ncbi:MAG TPA: hypothetical protein VFM18_22610, partial [Methanosarcina sp.]|nr:hypothetical protein [Methanosarcina sp.]